jgi:diguanylate cyclase (GGDEF)-like protein/PAS domain S-box-containing protein
MTGADGSAMTQQLEEISRDRTRGRNGTRRGSAADRDNASQSRGSAPEQDTAQGCGAASDRDIAAQGRWSAPEWDNAMQSRVGAVGESIETPAGQALDWGHDSQVRGSAWQDGKRVERRASATESLDTDPMFRICVNAMSEGLILQDAGGLIRFCNRSAEHILGMTAEDMRVGNLFDPLGTMIAEDGAGLSGKQHPITLALSTGQAQQGVVASIRRPDGQYRWLLLNAQPVFEAGDAAPAGAVATFVDITGRKDSERQASEQIEEIRRLNSMMLCQMIDLKTLNDQLEALATQDGLTGLKNHRAFHKRLSEEFDRSQRHGTPLSVILLDVDHFKLYNDAFGHPAGDTVLSKLAAILQENARDSDVLGRNSATDAPERIVARHGGEEFSVILPHTDASGAMKVAERLRVAIQNAAWDNRPITASFGIASLVPGITDPTALITTADKALYRSKTRGRNRVSCAPGARSSVGRSASTAAVHQVVTAVIQAGQR